MSRSSRMAAVFVATGLVLAGSTALAQHTFQNNIFFENANNFELPDAAGHQANFCNDEIGAGPLLNDPYAPAVPFPQGSWNPDFRPAAGSVALGQAGCGVAAVDQLWERLNQDPTCQCPEVDCPETLDVVCFRGAVPPEGFGDDWTEGWINTDYGFSDVPAGPVNVIQLGPGAIPAADLNWTAFDGVSGDRNVYVLNGRTRVTAGNTLTIEAGTYIVGSFANVGYLTIDQGARIEANGTADAPIIFTSDRPNGAMGRSDWGGVVLHGDACANCADCIGGALCESEGDAGTFCGTDDLDNKGRIRYTRVEYSGIEISINNELNCWTFNGVGCETDAQYLQAHMGSDDLFEWFGGSMRAKYLYGSGGADDGVDWQMGFRGKVQFALVVQYEDAGDSGIEADNNEFNFNAPCRSNPIIANCTFIGRGPDTAAGGGSGIRLRRGTDAQIANCILMGWNNPGNWALRIDDPETTARGFYLPVKNVLCDSPADVPELAVSDFQVRTFPNPVVDRALFQFSLPQAGRTQVQIFDTNGRLVDTVVNSDLSAGKHSITWDVPADRPAGTYFYQLSTDGIQTTGRLVTLD